MELSPDEKTRSVRELIDALFAHVLDDEDPIWIGDEATIFDVSLATPEELVKRCSNYYRSPVTLEELHRPLCKLLPELERRRRAAGQEPV